MSDVENNNTPDDKQESEELAKALDSIATSLSEAANTYAEQNEKQPLLKRKSFWSMMIFLSGFLGLIVSWQQQIQAVEIASINKSIQEINQFKSAETKAISKARVTIINQTLDCPVTDKAKLVAMHQARNRTLGLITSATSGLSIPNTKEINQITHDIIGKIYDIKTDQICSINGDDFDNELLQLNIKLNDIINKEIKIKQKDINRINGGLIENII